VNPLKRSGLQLGSVVWNSRSPISLIKTKLFKFFQCAFRLSADQKCDDSVRLCDIASLYKRILKPWNNDSEFMAACITESFLINEQSDKKRGPKNPEHYINRDLLDILTTHSTMLFNPEKSFADILEDLSVDDKSGSPSSQQMVDLLHERQMWEKYVIHMSPFYFTLLSDLIYTMQKHKYEYDFEDATILYDLSNLFKKRELKTIEQASYQPSLSRQKQSISNRSLYTNDQKNSLFVARAETFYIDGIIKAEKFEDIANATMRILEDFERELPDERLVDMNRVIATFPFFKEEFWKAVLATH
jgi:hypothetical protein